MTENATAPVLISIADVRALDRRPLLRRAYRSRPPAYANLEVLNKNWYKHNISVLRRSEARVPDGLAIRVANAIVYGFGAIALEDGRIVAESLHSNGRGGAAAPGGIVRTIDEPAALLRKAGDNNYGHWLVEILPRVLEFRRAFPDVRLKFAIPANPIALRQTRLASLAWVGVSEREVIWLDNDPTLFSDLRFISANSIHSHTHDADGIRSIVSNAVPIPAVAWRKLYLPRPEGSRRRPVNEADLIKLLNAHDYIVFRPEQASLEDQVRIFSEASSIIAPSGAALTNIMFCSPPCRVLSLLPNLGNEFFFWDIANMRGLEFSFLFSRATQPERVVHSDYEVDLDVVARWLTT